MSAKLPTFSSLLIWAWVWPSLVLGATKMELKAEVVDLDMPGEAKSEQTILASPLPAQEACMGNGSGPFVPRFPAFTLKDPLGKEHDGPKLFGQTGMLIMFSVPNMVQYEKQVRWHRFLKREKWPERQAPLCVVVEDLSQQTLFKERARAALKEKFAADQGLLFLIDEDGAVRRRFQVGDNETVLLLVDAEGRIVHHEADDVVPDPASARRLMQQVARLAEGHASAKPVLALPGAAGVTLTASAREP